jgi:hypothetical protein
MDGGAEFGAEAPQAPRWWAEDLRFVTRGIPDVEAHRTRLRLRMQAQTLADERMTAEASGAQGRDGGEGAEGGEGDEGGDDSGGGDGMLQEGEEESEEAAAGAMYEQQRLARIRRNKEALERVGLGVDEGHREEKEEKEEKEEEGDAGVIRSAA